MGAHTARFVSRRLDPNDSWREDAACRGLAGYYDDDPWYPTSPSGTEFGKRICRTCPVRQPCLQYALDNREDYGTWGGLDEWERARLNGRRIRH